MTTAFTLLEAKKAKILEDAQNAAAEIERDQKQLQELANKYGLSIVEGNLNVQRPSGTTFTVSRKQGKESLHRRAVCEAEEIIRAAGKPVSLGSLYDSLIQRGIKLGGQTPRNTLSAYLSGSENFESIRKGWWGLKESPSQKNEAPPGGTQESAPKATVER